MRVGQVVGIEAVGTPRHETLDEVYDEVWDLVLENLRALVRGKASREVVHHFLPDNRTEGWADASELTFAFDESEGSGVSAALSRHWMAVSVEAMREGLDAVIAPLGWRIVGAGGVAHVRGHGDRFMEVSGTVYRVEADDEGPRLMGPDGMVRGASSLSPAARKKAARVAEGACCLCELCRKLDAGKGPIDPVQARQSASTSSEFRSVSKALKNRRHARKLVMYGRGLTDVPAEIGQLAWLEEVWLWDNHLQTLPPQVGQLQRLRDLSLRDNRGLARLPDTIGACTALERLDLKGAYALETLPESMRHLRRLRHLDLSHTGLERLPSWLGELSDLETLNLYSVPLQELPMVLLQLPKLAHLDLRDTAPVGFLAGVDGSQLSAYRGKEPLLRAAVAEGHGDAWCDFPFDEMPALTSLQLRSTSRLPASVLRCRRLTDLDISGSRSRPLAPLPEALAELPSLTRLLYEESTTRVLPEALLARGILRFLSVSHAQIETVPDAIGALKDLRDLRLGYNAIREVSPRVLACRELEYVSFRKHLMEALPEGLRALPALKMLWE